MVMNALKGCSAVYGDGQNVRDWLMLPIIATAFGRFWRAAFLGDI